MPWKSIKTLQLKLSFVRAVLTRRQSFAANCREFAISRRCGYRWWRRFQRDGQRGFQPRSHAPRAAQWLRQRWQDRVFACRRAHPSWGPLKLRWWLAQQSARKRLPSARTMGRWLTAAGFSARRIRRARRGPRVVQSIEFACRPNDVWTIDFKGDFCTADGTRMYPLTVRDLASRYVLAVQGVPAMSEVAVRSVLTRLFRRHGLPRTVRVDNGAPFGRPGPLGLSQLSVWWLRLGIQVAFTRRACPQDNGAHEQMHRVLKRETIRPPAANVAAQQRRFHWWRHYYNHLRPHAALGQNVPARHYRVSQRRWPDELALWKYPKNYDILRPRGNGCCFWQGRERMVGRALERPWACDIAGHGGWKSTSVRI
jgi:putative transposase